MGLSIDREKVIEELEHCRQLDFEMKKPTQVAIDNALALLKEQEAVEPEHNLSSLTDWFCGKCGRCISRFEDYCSSCGQAMKWDA